ncbi:protein spire homolog 1-like [Pantherophis guttatus]|uniref:Protein spire homolog 1-like n=1 Tax=Pantherophis guttatus TaxID=94885 RepID=A0A6P9BSC9_PANGU|nr:protein spire homolog 1-like [Pantherophis guttatus]
MVTLNMQIKFKLKLTKTFVSDGHINQQPREILEDKLTESLGKLIYKALDWGIESHMERELSESLAKLITFMLKLNAETSNTAVALQDVIKICEDHFHRPSEAASHYTTICQMLFSEYIELQKLTLTIQSCKEYLGRMEVEDCSATQKTNNWKSMRLQKVMGKTLHSIPPGEGILSPYSMVVDDIKNKRYSLHAVSVWKLKEKTCRKFSLHEQLMMEVKNPPKLRPIFEQKSSNNDKGDIQKFVLDSPHNSIIAEQNISINLSKAKKTRPSCIHSDLELKIKLRELCEDGRGSETKLSPTYNRTCLRWSLPSIADLMGTRYLEIKDSCQRETSNLPSRAELCLLCHNQFFIWPYVCHLCSSVICKDCCIKMSMPVRPCARLPLNVFKAIQLDKEDDQGLHNQKAAQLEVEQWDSSRVPLVFEPHCLTPPFAGRIKSMMDWPSMDICIKCEQYLLEMLSHHSPCRKRRLSWTELE